jgi:hypothetical protein
VVPAVHQFGVTMAQLGILESQLPSQVLNMLRELSLTSAPPASPDVVGEILKERYGIAQSSKWRALLGAEYIHALGLLKQADAAFFAGPSHWLSHQNSFNQVVFLALQAHLSAVGAAGIVRTRNKIGELIDFGVTLDGQNEFSRHHPVVANAFRDVNQRRNRLPGSHPYERRSIRRTEYLRAAERSTLAASLAQAFTGVLSLVP